MAYEYKVAHTSKEAPTPGQTGHDDVIDILNSEGKDGWRLVDLSQQHGFFTVYLERETT